MLDAGILYIGESYSCGLNIFVCSMVIQSRPHSRQNLNQVLKYIKDNV